ncbi:hypothetical protein OAC51_02175 [Flavobacteriaceae bacterium]|nr:hypothetical protein [Flavobacteriaceae bacterium]
MKNYIIIIFSVLLISCSVINQTESIIDNTFSQLSDSLKLKPLNFRLIPPPPIYVDDTIYAGFDTLQLRKNELKRKILIDSIRRINPKIMISINDTVKLSFTAGLKRDLISDRILYDSIFKDSYHFPNKHYPNQPIRHGRINLEKFELVSFDQLIARYGSHPKVWYAIEDRFFGGAIFIRGILLNNEKKYGVFQLSYTIVPVDGIDYMVAIEKKNDTWFIKEIKNRY